MSINKKIAKLLIDNYKFFPKNTKNDILKNYKKVYSNEKFEFYQSSELQSNVVAAFKSAIVCWKKNSKKFTIYPNYCNRHLKFNIKFNNKNFPDLIKDSKIKDILIIPFLKNSTNETKYNRWRVIVITDKSQIYHNFPAKNDLDNLEETFLDIKRFEESVVWDIPGRKYPSMSRDCSDVEIYFPHLPSSCYEYHPKINIKSKYGNNGFDKYSFVNNNGKREKVSRFYIPIRNYQTNPFTFMGGFEPDYKMTLLGTYESNKDVGVRTCLFATSDGGRSWYAKMEFNDYGEYEFKQGKENFGNNFGNELINFNYDNSNTNVKNLSLQKRVIDYELANTERWDKPIEINKIYCKKTVIIETHNKHELETGNIVRINGDDNSINQVWENLFYVRENKNKINTLFKVKKINNNTIELYEFVSNSNSIIACRHIHHINRVRDGWILGTGEIYPNGWLFYIHMKEADSYSNINASDEICIKRLNTKRESVQRTVGAEIIEQKNKNILIFASDHDTLIRKNNSIAGISRGSTGIYIGNLEDVDNFDKYEILFETKEPAFFFKKLSHYYVFCGQRGELLVFDSITNNTIIHSSIDRPFFHYKGSTYTYMVVDNYIIKFKE